MEAEDLDVSYLSTIGSNNDCSGNATMQINGQSVVFKLDTGAEVTAITEPTLTKLGNAQVLSAAKSLCGPDKKPLKVMGTLTTELAYTNTAYWKIFEVKYFCCFCGFASNLENLTARIFFDINFIIIIQYYAIIRGSPVFQN